MFLLLGGFLLAARCSNGTCTGAVPSALSLAVIIVATAQLVPLILG